MEPPRTSLGFNNPVRRTEWRQYKTRKRFCIVRTRANNMLVGEFKIVSSGFAVGERKTRLPGVFFFRFFLLDKQKKETRRAGAEARLVVGQADKSKPAGFEPAKKTGTRRCP